MRKEVVPYWAYLPVLDSLRAVSISVVLIAHFGLDKYIPGGFGVTLFFFISGFIITRLLVGENDRTGSISLRQFYMRRFLRLTPALLFFIAASIFFLMLAGWAVSTSEILAALFYFSNYYHIFVGFHGSNGMPSPFIILWSLAVEEHFYLFYPLLLIFAGRKGNSLLYIIVVIIAASLFWRLFLCYQIGLDNLAHDRIYKGTDTRIDAILYGALLSLLMFRLNKLTPRLASVLVVCGLGGLLFSFVFREENFRQGLRYSLQGISLIPVVWWALSDRFPAALKNIMNNNILILIGKLSYSIYLFHWLGFCIATWLVGELFNISWIAIACVVTVVGSSASYFLIERPMLNIRRSFKSHA